MLLHYGMRQIICVLDTSNQSHGKDLALSIKLVYTLLIAFSSLDPLLVSAYSFSLLADQLVSMITEDGGHANSFPVMASCFFRH